MPNVQDDAVPRLRAAHSVLETTVMMALLDRQAPSEGELALAAGLGPREIQRIRDALPRSPHRG